MATGLIDNDPQESNASQSEPQERRSSWDHTNDSQSLELTSRHDGPRSRREMLHTLADRYYAEKRRADDAERMLQDLIIRLKTINEARLQALHDAAKANEELKLYKIQLRTAQHEIYKAQDTIEAVDRQRYNAEKEAATFRSKTRRLNEDILMLAAREEAWKLGLQEGLNRGRSNEENEYAEEAEEDALDDDVDSYDESSNDSNTRPPSLQNRPPSRTHPSPSLAPMQLPSNPPTVGHSVHPSENVRPLSVRSGHTRPSSRLRATPSLTPAPLPGNRSPQGIRPPENVRPVSIRSGYTRPSSRQHATPSSTQVPLQPPPSQSIPGHPSENVRPVSVRSGYTRPSSTQRATPSLTPAPLSGHPSPSSQSIRPSENVRPVSIRSGYTRPSSRQHATPSSTQVPLLGHQPPPSQSIPPSENVRPVSIRSGHTRPSSRQHVSHSPVPVPSTSNTRPSSPYRPISPYRPAPPDNFIPSLDADNKIRIPPPFEFQRGAMTPEPPVSPQLPAMSDTSQEAVMIPGPHAKAPQQHRNRYHRRHSSSESNSSTLSALDIINDRPPMGIGTPMSIIPEVASVQSSAIQLPDGDHHSRRQRSFGDNSAHTLNLDNSQYMEAPITHLRPHSRSSYAGSTRNAQRPQSRSGNSYDSSPPNITVQPSSRRTSVVQSGSLNNTSLHNGSVLELSMLVPGGYHPVVDPMLSPTHSGRYAMNSYAENDDDAVGSVIGTDPLTTPPSRRYTSIEPDWSGAAASTAHVPLLPSNSFSGPVPRGLNSLNVDAIMDSRKKIGKGKKRKQ